MSEEEGEERWKKEFMELVEKCEEAMESDLWGEGLRLFKKISEGFAKIADKKTKELHEPDLVKRAVKALEKKGYKVYEQPSTPYGRPDITAMKMEDNVPTELLTIEVKGVDDPLAEKLRRYYLGEIGRGGIVKTMKFILILPIPDGKDFEIWGLNQIS